MEKINWVRSNNLNDFFNLYDKLPSHIKSVVKDIVGKGEFLYYDFEGHPNKSSVTVPKVFDDNPKYHWFQIFGYNLGSQHFIIRKPQKNGGVLYELKLNGHYTFGVPPMFIYKEKEKQW